MTVAAIIAAIGAIAATILSARLVKKVQEVHVLVNSQLSDVLAKLEKVTAERDALDERTGERRGV